MDLVLKMRDMKVNELADIIRRVKEEPESVTVLEMKIAKYLQSDKNTVDFLDRHISKAPQEVDVKSDGQKISAGIFVGDLKGE